MRMIALVLLGSTLIIAQENLTLFEKHIPDKFRDSPETMQTFENIIETITQTNIDLLYYFFESLKIDAVNNNTDKFKNFIRYLEFEKRRSALLKEEWLTFQRKVINESNLEEDLKRKAKGSFPSESSIEPIKKIIDYPVSPNLNYINYYRVVYYSQSAGNSYNPNEDYMKASAGLEENIIQEFRDVHKQLIDRSYPKSLSIPLFDKMIKFWYVFNRRIDKNDSLNQFIVDYYKNNFSTKGGFASFDVAVFYNSNSVQDYSYTGATTTPLNIVISEAVHVNQYGISFGYRYKLKEQKSIFSSINFMVSAAYGKSDFNSNLEDMQNTVYYTYYPEENIRDEYNYEINFTNSEFKIKSASYIDFAATTPIFYFSHNFCFYFGANVYWSSMEYSLKYEYNSVEDYTRKSIIDGYDDYIIDQNTVNDQGSYEREDRESSIGVVPLIIMELSLIENLNIGFKEGLYYHALFLSARL